MREHDSYLQPYRRAAAEHGDGFQSLLWLSPATQAARFDAIVQLCPPAGLNVLDAGCGRADLLDYLIGEKLAPAHYVGIEAMPQLAAAARRKDHPNCTIVEADYIRQPAQMLVGADVVIFCGSLNTLSQADFYRTLNAAFSAASQCLVFNFLSSRRLASADWLTWHRHDDVLAWARRLSKQVDFLDNYMEGDCTIAMRTGD